MKGSERASRSPPRCRRQLCNINVTRNLCNDAILPTYCNALESIYAEKLWEVNKRPCIKIIKLDLSGDLTVSQLEKILKLETKVQSPHTIEKNTPTNSEEKYCQNYALYILNFLEFAPSQALPFLKNLKKTMTCSHCLIKLTPPFAFIHSVVCYKNRNRVVCRPDTLPLEKMYLISNIFTGIYLLASKKNNREIWFYLTHTIPRKLLPTLKQIYFTLNFTLCEYSKPGQIKVGNNFRHRFNLAQFPVVIKYQRLNPSCVIMIESELTSY